MSPIEIFRHLLGQAPPYVKLDLVHHLGDEEMLSATFEGKRCVANATIWERPHVGGLVDFTVVDWSEVQQFWRHLEAPSETALRDAWQAMFQVIARIEGKDVSPP